MRRTVVSIGGSVLISREDNNRHIEDLARLIVRLTSQTGFGIVTGGGWIARYYIKKGRNLGATEDYLDLMGIDVTRVNARLLITAIRKAGGDVNPHPPHTIEEAVKLAESYDIVVMGGTVPGHTTDAVSAMLASAMNVKRLVNATAVDGVYTKDPKKYDDAQQIPELTYNELKRIIRESGESGAGPNVVFDPVAADIIEKDGIETLIVDGKDLIELEKTLTGQEFKGTVIHG